MNSATCGLKEVGDDEGGTAHEVPPLFSEPPRSFNGSSGPVPSLPCSSSTDRPDAHAHRSGCRETVPRRRARHRASCRRCCDVWCDEWAWLAPGNVETLRQRDEDVCACGKADVAVF